MIVLVLPDVTQDDVLLGRARDGDKEAISEIYRQYVDSIYQFCRLRLGNAEQAEDITSTVFTKLLQSIAKGNAPQYHLRGWLFKVARNAIYDTYGKNIPLPLETIEQIDAGDSINPETIVNQELNADALRASLQELSPDQQEVILLRFDQQLSLRETADILGKNINTVKALQFRAVNRLRDVLQRAGVQDL
ncbi:MAG: sigma-70 family RNA polymerase sigma factor [Chloroflexota bacterium]